MLDLVLWGAGGHGKCALAVARAMEGFETIVFLDDGPAVANEFCGCESLEVSRYLSLSTGRTRTRFLISIGNNRTRAECFLRALDYDLLPATLVHPSAVISQSAELKDGTLVMPRVVINPGARIGKNCILNTAAVIEHDCQMGDHVHISPGALLAGGVKVHSFAHVGIGAIILPGIEIGEGAMIGAGAVVRESVPAGVTVVGIPARSLIRKTVSSEP